MEIPKDHQTIMPYLILNGASQFFDFAKSVFNAEEVMSRLQEDGETIMHSEIKINGSTIMYSEASEDWKEKTANLFIYVEDADAVFQKAIDMGAEVVLPLRTEDYGRTGGIKDPFGNVWWITSVNH